MRKKVAVAAARANVPPEVRSSLRHYENRLNEQNHVLYTSLKAPRKVKLTGSPASLRQAKEHLAPIRVAVHGHNYSRVYDARSVASEKLVRKNLELLISEVQRTVVEALIHSRISVDFQEVHKSDSLKYAEHLCLDENDGIRSRGFAKLDGGALQKNRAFLFMVRQFFKDEDFARKVCRDAVEDYLGGAKAAGGRFNPG